MTPLADPPTGAGGPLDEYGPLDEHGLLDDADLAVLAELAELYTDLDPMPADLLPRITFALELEDVDIEVFRLAQEYGVPAGARGAEETRTITFDSESLTVMFSVSPASNDTVRLDGWLAPPAAHQVELRTERGPLTARADAEGRFSLDGVPHGLAQIVVHPATGSINGRAVVTPSVVL
ncbi:MAG TPA: hypothetical protein VLJ59_18615 [Mycobacteriales bacterium]|nr:hypothetical protein [Mycobacteriales bacterium]